jgi:hypothetical protein
MVAIERGLPKGQARDRARLLDDSDDEGIVRPVCPRPSAIDGTTGHLPVDEQGETRLDEHPIGHR